LKHWESEGISLREQEAKLGFSSTHTSPSRNLSPDVQLIAQALARRWRMVKRKHSIADKRSSRRRTKQDRRNLSPQESAVAASLRYVDVQDPGIHRKRVGRYFTYLDVDGNRVRDRQTLAWIKSLVIPPAWQQVWICSLPNGHIQATGRDARGRKQYRYHPRWRVQRSETKFDRMIMFGKALPTLRERIQHDLALPGLPFQKVLAAVIRLLEISFIRVGNLEYALSNKSYGLTTLQDRHISIDGSMLRFCFPGKSHVKRMVRIQDRQLARIVKNCRDLPGQELFQYIGDAGEPRPISSTDVNTYLRDICGQEFSAKDFRTWGGTTLAVRALCELPEYDTDAAAQQNIVQMIKTVAAQLGNTPAVCRKYYVHLAVLDAYRNRSLFALLGETDPASDSPFALQGEERLVMKLLHKVTEAS
jgi:DNA topoisomerase-1